MVIVCFFFQAEDGIRDLVRSRGLGDVYKRQNIGNAFTWTQKQESTWIKEAVSALLIGEQSKHTVPVDAIKERWIDGQLPYHQNAFKRDSSKHRMNEGIAKWMLAASLLLFLLVLVLEFFSDSAMTGSIFNPSFPILFLHHPDLPGTSAIRGNNRNSGGARHCHRQNAGVEHLFFSRFGVACRHCFRAGALFACSTAFGICSRQPG